MIRYALLAWVTLLVAPTVAFAAPSPTLRLFSAITEIDGSTAARGRAELISATAAYCEELSRVYPTNSPAEKAWLIKEKAGETQRVLRALSSEEQGREKASNFNFSCGILTRQSIENPSDWRPFVALALIFQKFSSDAEFFAEKNGVSSEEFGLFMLDAVASTLMEAALSLPEL